MSFSNKTTLEEKPAKLLHPHTLAVDVVQQVQNSTQPNRGASCEAANLTARAWLEKRDPAAPVSLNSVSMQERDDSLFYRNEHYLTP